MAPDDIKAHINFMHRFNKERTEAGQFVDAQGLALPEEARVVLHLIFNEDYSSSRS